MLLNRQVAEQQRIQYLNVAHFDNATAQAITNEALKYQDWKYVYGGSNPNTFFDCSGFVQWCYSLLENIWTYHKLKLIEKGQSY